MTLQGKVTAAFVEHYGALPAFVVRAPGRVNLIGEHTDYNDGFVLPMAIDRAMWIALQPSGNRRVSVHSLDMQETALFDLDELKHNGPTWVEYIKGVAWALQEDGYPLLGWEGVMVGDIPIGAGLSSSAALEMAAIRAFLAVSSSDWDPAAMARIGQRTENEWMGVKTGIMDQMVSAAGEADHALLIDCRSLETEAVPLPPDTAVVILDTGTRRGLVDSAYNERRQQCEAAAAYFGVPALRDVDLAAFQEQARRMDGTVFRRARHVVTENHRVLQARSAMLKADAVTLGQLMNASHVSLRDDFEVSSQALDNMVEIAQQQDGCYGARMTGAGFGGCAVALILSSSAVNFVENVTFEYTAATKLKPSIYVCQAAQGAELIVNGQ
ncbi:MAG: galactokinase [Chloroflexota bacterium]